MASNPSLAPNTNPLTTTLKIPKSVGQTSTYQRALTYAQVQQVWIQAGGNPQAAPMAAAVADASSGLNPDTTSSNTDGTRSVGLWQIRNPGVPPGSIDPLANARAAVQQSNNGTDWTRWCVAWSDNNCGQSGGQYLANGSNALAGLAANIQPSSYSVNGSVPAGTGIGASSATATSQGSTSTSSKSGSSLVLVAVVVIVLATTIYFVRKGQGQGQQDAAITSRQRATPETQGPSAGSNYVQGYYR